MRPTLRAALATLAAGGLLTTLPVLSAAADTAPVTVVTSDFEDGTTQGWGPRGGVTVAVTDAAAHGGTAALAVTGRTATWEGATLDVLPVLEKGVPYTVSAWVRLAAGAAADSARISVQRDTGGTVSYDQVAGNTPVTAGGWTQVTGRYTLTTDATSLGLYVETAATTGGFLVDDVTVSYVPPTPIQTDIPRVRDVVTEFPVGVAITAAETLGVHGELLARHFDTVTPGNALKWDATEPAEGRFIWAQADPLIAYAQAHDMAIRGHTLVWHQQTPAWVFTRADGTPMTATAEDKALLLTRLENHVRTVAGHYGDAIGTWDVVNEVIDETQPDGLRRSRWFEIAGLDYVRTAFRVAREAAPHATLVINDYNTNVPAKRDALYELVRTLRAEGVPIDAVGHQMHINVSWPSVAETEAMLRTFVPLGVEQQITEMDVSIYRNETETFPEPPADRLRAQALVYRDMMALFRRYAGEVTSVTLWGLADDNTWLDTFPVTRKDAPLLFDTRLQAKPAYWGVVDPGRLEPTTPPPAATCRVDYRVTGSWPGGFQGDVRITNTGTAALTGWTLRWTWTGGQRVTQAWNGTAAQDGAAVTVTPAAWNRAVPAGGSVSAGFLAARGDANPAPAAFTLDGAACTTG